MIQLRSCWMQLSVIVCLLMALSFGATTVRADDASVYQQASKLLQGSFRDRGQAIELLAEKHHPQTIELLQLMRDGDLYYNKKDHQLYRVPKHRKGEAAYPIAGGDTVVIKSTRAFRKIILNNQLRSKASQIEAELALTSDSAKARLAAVKELLGSTDSDTRALIQKHYDSEDNAEVRAEMGVALAIAAIAEGSSPKTSEYIKVLGASLEPAARNALMQFANTTKDAGLKQQAEMAVEKIDGKVKFYSGLQTVFFGLSLGSVLVLAGIGLAITFGVMGVINMAHGELIMLGAYTTFVVQQLMPNHIGLSILVSIPAAFLVAGAVGVLIERCVIRFLYGRPLETLLATFGISLILQQAVRSIFTALNRSVQTPDWMSGQWVINPVFALTWNRIYIIFFCLLVFAALMLILKRTPLGLQVRAVSQNRAMARAMGVRSKWVDALTFGLGSGVAGVAGVALSQLTNVGPNLGQSYIIDSFMVVVFGGVGNLWGTLVAGLSLGVANKLLEPWAGAVLGKIMILVFVILFIQKRPRGLFPQRGRAAED